MQFFGLGKKKPDAKEVLKEETRNMKRNEREIERERCGCPGGVRCEPAAVVLFPDACTLNALLSARIPRRLHVPVPSSVEQHDERVLPWIVSKQP